jgi:glycosyltransferase involved in cell wall biosynthesis
LKTKVLHCPTVVGGNPSQISRVQNELGLDSFLITLKRNSFDYSVDKIVLRERDNLLTVELKRIFAILTIYWKFDIVHYNFGTSFASPLYPGKPGEAFFRRFFRKVYSFYTWTLQCLELSLVKALGKPIFVHYQGDDARQGAYSLDAFEYSIASQVDHHYYNKSSDSFKRKCIERMSRFADGIYALNPDLLHVLPKGSKFIPYSHLDLSKWLPSYTQDTAQPLRIGHAPSHRKAKGTHLILDALESLKKEGFDFDLILVEGISHEEAYLRYKSVDILVDQLFAGWYGGLAVEAMALGKPVLVYIREEDLHFIPSEMREDLPFIRVTPDNIKEVLKKVLRMPRTEILSVARASRAFVEKWHDPVRIVSKIKADYANALSKRGKTLCVE